MFECKIQLWSEVLEVGIALKRDDLLRMRRLD